MFDIYIRHLHSTFTFDVYIWHLYLTFIFGVYMWRTYLTIITLLPGLQDNFLRNFALRLVLRILTIITLLSGLQENFLKFRSTTNPCMILELYDKSLYNQDNYDNFCFFGCTWDLRRLSPYCRASRRNFRNFALRQITLVFWSPTSNHACILDGDFEGPQGSGAAKSEPVGEGGEGEGEEGMQEKNLTTPSGRVGNKLRSMQRLVKHFHAI